MLPHTTATTAVHDRIIEVVRRVGGDTDVCRTTIEAILGSEPNRIIEAVTALVPARAIITSTLERRLLLAEHHGAAGWVVADLAGQPHRTRTWPSWAATAIELDEPSSWISTANISRTGIHRLTRPNVLLAALYHPEVFPLPRFPLGISDLARAARSTPTGQVRLLDMQLGITLDAIVATSSMPRPTSLEYPQPANTTYSWACSTPLASFPSRRWSWPAVASLLATNDCCCGAIRGCWSPEALVSCQRSSISAGLRGFRSRNSAGRRSRNSSPGG